MIVVRIFEKMKLMLSYHVLYLTILGKKNIFDDATHLSSDLMSFDDKHNLVFLFIDIKKIFSCGKTCFLFWIDIKMFYTLNNVLTNMFYNRQFFIMFLML